MSLDTKYRPLRYSDVLGQQGTLQILKQYVKTGAGFHQSYLFAGSYGSGKCIVGDTLVSTDRGLVPIASLMGPNQIDPIHVGVVQEGKTPSVAAFTYRGGLRETIRVETHCGYSIEGTPNHRIRVMKPNGLVEWAYLGEIQSGDFACIVPYGTFGSGADLSSFQYMKPPGSAGHSSIACSLPQSVTPEWGRLLGYLVGDGSCTAKNGFVIACADAEIQQDQLRLLETLTGSATFTPDKRSATGLAAIRSHRVQARAFAAFAGLTYAKAGTKEVPWSVLASPKEVVSEFLRAYMEADGHVSRSGIEVTTKSKKLAQQVQLLLLQFGVVSRLSIKPHKKYGPYWRICILSPWWSTYVKEIGFISTRKMRAAQRLLEPRRSFVQTRSRELKNIREVVPYQKDHIRAFYAGLPSNQRTRDTGIFFQCQNPSTQIQCTTRQIAKILSGYPEYDIEGHFATLSSKGYFYDPISSVTRGCAEVFDLTVPQGEMFAANGFMNHNTTLARILARALLCEAPVEGEACDQCASCQSFLTTNAHESFTEMDAATNSGKADMLKLTDALSYSTFSGKRRLYVIDECFTEDAHLITPEGPISIKELVEKQYSGFVLSYNLENQEPVWRPLTNWYSQGTREVLSLSFDNGITLEVTPEHLFYTRNRGWVRADSLLETDDIVDASIECL